MLVVGSQFHFQRGVEALHKITRDNKFLRKVLDHHCICTPTSAARYVCLTSCETAIEVNTEQINCHALAEKGENVHELVRTSHYHEGQ